MASEANASGDRVPASELRTPRRPRPASTSLADGQRMPSGGSRRTTSISGTSSRDSSNARSGSRTRQDSQRARTHKDSVGSRRSASGTRRTRNESLTSVGSRRRRNESVGSVGSRRLRTISVTSSVIESYDGCVCCNPYSRVMRYMCLVFMCFLGFGAFFCYDNPGALQVQVKQDMDITTTQFAQLYAWYSWPNVVLCFVGGYLMDSFFGVRWGAIIFASFVCIGHLMFAIGGLFDMFWLMCFGRFVFGIGGECLQVAQNSYAVLWFKGKELNFVFGLQLSFARLGSTINFMVMGGVYNSIHHYFRGHECIGMTLLAALVTCVLSFFCAVVLAIMEKQRVKVLKRNMGDSFGTPDKIRLSDVKYFGACYWLLAGICVCFYIGIMPLIGLGQLFFSRKFSLSNSMANSVNGSLYLVSAIASPLFGYVVDKTGRNVMWTYVAAMLGVACHALLAFTFINPYVGMVGLGISYSILASSLWPMVALILPVHQLGTAYGIMQSIQNLGVAVMTMVAGYIVDEKGYFILEVFFMIWIAACVIFAVLLWMLDANTGGFLNMSIQQRDDEEKRLLASELLEEEDDREIRSPRDLLVPRSDFYIRNRYLTRLGASPPTHADVRLQSAVHRHNYR